MSRLTVFLVAAPRSSPTLAVQSEQGARRVPLQFP